MKLKQCIVIRTFVLILFFSMASFGLRAEEENMAVSGGPRFMNYMRTKFPDDSLKFYPGMFHTYFAAGHYYWEIPQKLLHRDFLITTTVLQAASQVDRSLDGYFGYGYDMRQGLVFTLEKQEHMLSCREVFTGQLRDTLSGGVAGLYARKDKTGLYQTFDIEQEDAGAILIDVTELLTTETPFVGLSSHYMDFNIGRFYPEYSYLYEIGGGREDVLLVRSVRTYQPAKVSEQMMGDRLPVPALAPWKIGVALYLLPEVPMRIRRMDERVEYMTERFDTYGRNSLAMTTLLATKRFRLEPRPEDWEKYKCGELVEPAQPIVFYIDREMPSFLIPYAISAVNGWGKAFEKAGFKNAISARIVPLPEEDSCFAVDNPHYSLISYKMSPRRNAYGGTIIDPRSGEVLCGRVSIYHSGLDLFQQWYFSQCSQVDPRVHRAVIPDSLLGQITEFVIAHEVGHCLGLCHNFIGSSSYSVAQIRDAQFIAEHGFGASIMDYMRFNFLARPEDHIPVKDLMPRIGRYDEFAIEWGYRQHLSLPPEKEEKDLQEWVTEKQKERALRFGYMGSRNPEAQSEDLSDDLLRANVLGMENLKFIIRNRDVWDSGKISEKDIWESRKTWLLMQYNLYIDQVVAYIGESYYSPRGEKLISERQQLEAIDFLKKYAFTDLELIYRQEKERNEFYQGLIASLLRKCERLSQSREDLSGVKFTEIELIDAIHRLVFQDSSFGIGKFAARKSIQRIYLDCIQRYIDSSSSQYIAALLMEELGRITAKAGQNTLRGEDRDYWWGIICNINAWMNK